MEIFKWHTFADSPLSQPDQEKDDLMLDHGEGRSTISRNQWFSWSRVSVLEILFEANGARDTRKWNDRRR